MVKLIGICGKIGSGKSLTAAHLLQILTPANMSASKTIAREYVFAAPLKKIARIFGFPDENLYGSQSDKARIYQPLGISAREFMQKFGTEICRNYLPQVLPTIPGPYNNVWINILHNQILIDTKKDLLADIDHVYSSIANGTSPSCVKKYAIISDVRFKDEAKYIKDNNGILLKIVRPQDNTGLTQGHQSEMEQDSIVPDIIIVNNGTKDDLYAKLQIFAQKLFAMN